MSVFIRDNTLKGSKMHRYNDIHEIAKTLISGVLSHSIIKDKVNEWVGGIPI